MNSLLTKKKCCCTNPFGFQIVGRLCCAAAKSPFVFSDLWVCVVDLLHKQSSCFLRVGGLC